jgi:hypothetical protein
MNHLPRPNLLGWLIIAAVALSLGSLIASVATLPAESPATRQCMVVRGILLCCDSRGCYAPA